MNINNDFDNRVREDVNVVICICLAVAVLVLIPAVISLPVLFVDLFLEGDSAGNIWWDIGCLSIALMAMLSVLRYVLSPRRVISRISFMVVGSLYYCLFISNSPHIIRWNLGKIVILRKLQIYRNIILQSWRSFVDMWDAVKAVSAEAIWDCAGVFVLAVILFGLLVLSLFARGRRTYSE